MLENNMTNITEPLLTQPKTTWRGAWIWASADEAARNVYAYFRRPFTTTGGQLSIDISADSFYWLYLDGEYIGHGPSRAALDYYTFDSYHLEVAPGAHCLAILVHHIGEINATVMTGRPGVLAEAILREGNSEQNLSTGTDWQCLVSDAWRRDLSCMMSHFGFWEELDLRRMPEGWMLPNFSGDNWTPPSVIGIPPCPPWTRLCPRDIALPSLTNLLPVHMIAAGQWSAGAEDDVPSKMVAARSRRPISIPSPYPLGEGGIPFGFSFTLPPVSEQPTQGDVDDGTYLTLDFGRTVSGYLEVEFSESVAGQCIELSYDDLLSSPGVINPERSYAHMTDRFLLPGGPCQVRTAHPRGFRYVMLDISGGGEVKIERLQAVEETYPFVLQPAFSSPDAELNTFYRKSAETVRICTTDAFTDCATRERVQWMEDLYVHARVAALAFGDTDMLRRALFQGAQNALPDGRINGFFPTERINCAFAGSSIMWLHLLVDYWRFAGDENITRLFPAARNLLALLDSLCDAQGLLASWPSGQFWDWAPIDNTGCLLLTNAAYTWALARLSEHALFREALGEELFKRASAMRTEAHARFWDESRHLYRDGQLENGVTPIYSQHANAMAVLASICPATGQAALLERITNPANLGPVPVGEHSLRSDNRPSPEQILPVGTLWFGHFLCQALFETGLDRLALAQMRTLWGAYADLPTFPETRIQKGNIFLCHGWAGGPAYLLPAYVLGVQPISHGWEEVLITPHPGDLSEASGTLATPLGPLTVSWRQQQGKCAVKVNAPEGMRVEVRQ